MWQHVHRDNDAFDEIIQTEKFVQLLSWEKPSQNAAQGPIAIIEVGY